MTPQLIPGGLLIVVEGIDGAGKTTLARSLAEILEGVGATVSMSKEPTQGQWGQLLRNSAVTGRLAPPDELRYLLLDRREHVENVITPALNRGEVVILDRYFPSMVAYQGAAGLPVDALMEVNKFAPRPDLLLLLDLPVQTGLDRIRARGDAPNHFETVDNLQRCREIFLGLDLPGLRIIDATQSAEDVSAEAQKHMLLSIAAKAEQVHGRSVEAMEMVGEYLPALSHA